MRTIIVPEKIQGTPTLGYREIVYPLEKLKAKYCYVRPRSSEHDIWLLLSESAEFDLYVAQRLTDLGWANRIEEEDLRKTILMNSRIERQEIEALIARKQEIETALNDVSSEIELGKADLSTDRDLRMSLKALFMACWVPHLPIRLAKINKFLWQKRQRLIAMVDRKVYRVLLGDEPEPTKSPLTFAQQAVNALIRFQNVMNWTDEQGHENRRVLQSLSDDFSQVLSEYLGSLEIGPPHPRVDPVRVLDNLLWFEFHGYQHFGWKRNVDSGRVEPG